MDPIVLRSIERMVAVLIGGLSIYLGFRLFLAIPERTESEGKFVLPGGISIYLTRIGPGAFFALFGALVVAISFREAISYKEGFQQTSTYRESRGQKVPAEKSQSEESASVSRSYTGFGGLPGEDLQLAREQVGRDIKWLNTRVTEILEREGRLKHGDVEPLIRRIKVALVKSIWDPRWGDFKNFKDWVDTGSAGPAPNETAGRLYLTGQV